MLMPECNGLECFRRLKELHPSIRALLFPASTNLVMKSRLSEIGICRDQSTKPFNIRSLIQTVAKTAGEKPSMIRRVCSPSDVLTAPLHELVVLQIFDKLFNDVDAAVHLLYKFKSRFKGVFFFTVAAPAALRVDSN